MDILLKLSMKQIVIFEALKMRFDTKLFEKNHGENDVLGRFKIVLR